MRVLPPMRSNSPPAYTLRPETARAVTTPESPLSTAFGFQAVAAPVRALSAAMAQRRRPPILVKSPPAYTVAPDSASARTLVGPGEIVSSASGFQPSAAPVRASTAARPLRG